MGTISTDRSSFGRLRTGLGSVSAVLDATGAVLSQQRYYPFGGERLDPGVTQTDFSFTGQRGTDFGLIDYRARFYSARLGRFTQPDTLIPDPANPQSFNRYSYGYNDPINSIDPTGHWSLKGNGFLIDGVCVGRNCRVSRTHHDPGSVNTKTADELGMRVRSENNTSRKTPPINPTIPELPPDGYISELMFDEIHEAHELEKESFDPIAQYVDYVVLPIFEFLGTYEEAINFGKPIYRQVKYVAPFGILEVAGDMFIQGYNDSKIGDLSPQQRAVRVVIEGIETWGTDKASTIVGAKSAVTLGPVGYLVASYETSVIVDNFWKTKANPWLYSNLNLGGLP